MDGYGLSTILTVKVSSLCAGHNFPLARPSLQGVSTRKYLNRSNTKNFNKNGLVMENSILHLFQVSKTSNDIIEFSIDERNIVRGISIGNDPAITLPPMSIIALPSVIFTVVMQISYIPASGSEDIYLYSQLFYRDESTGVSLRIKYFFLLFEVLQIDY